MRLIVNYHTNRKLPEIPLEPGEYFCYNLSNNSLTISPRLFSSSANVFIVIGDLSFSSVNSASAVVPVINLSAEYVSTLIGDGTMTNPYRQQGEAV